MKILLIAASFFGYSAEIKKSLESRGYSVIWREDRPGIDFWTKTLIRASPSLVRARTEAYFDEIIQRAIEADVSEVLIIKGEALSASILAKLRRSLPKARIILYFWDSYRNMPPDSAQKVALVDKALSFDLVDVAKDSRLGYRPLFFLNEYAALRPACTAADIDLLFVGTAHSDRYAVLSRIARALPPGLRFERILYLPSKKMWFVRKAVSPSYWRAREAEFVFQPLSKSSVMQYIERAKVVVDIERSVQTGFTMRTIEMFGASRKLLTTNRNIVKADFYIESNQQVIDREFPRISDEIFHSAWTSSAQELSRKYSIDGWIDDILR